VCGEALRAGKGGGRAMMTVHVLHAGDGYTYLTRQVASGDVTRGRGESLSDYYVHDGNPPGRWVGEGLADLRVSGLVAEEQMRVLLGVGRHRRAVCFFQAQDGIGASRPCRGLASAPQR